MTNRIGLTQLPRKAQQHVLDHYGVAVDAPAYRRCFDGAMSNKFPAEFTNGRWTVADEKADLDRVVAALGMVPSNAKKLGRERSTVEHAAA